MTKVRWTVVFVAAATVFAAGMALADVPDRMKVSTTCKPLEGRDALKSEALVNSAHLPPVPFGLLVTEDRLMMYLTGLPGGCSVRVESKSPMQQVAAQPFSDLNDAIAERKFMKKGESYVDRMGKRCSDDPEKFLRSGRFIYEPGKYYFSLEPKGFVEGIEPTSFCGILIDQNSELLVLKSASALLGLLVVGDRVFVENLNKP